MLVWWKRVVTIFRRLPRLGNYLPPRSYDLAPDTPERAEAPVDSPPDQEDAAQHCTLDLFAELSSSTLGVAVSSLRLFDMIQLKTTNGTCELLLLDPQTGQALLHSNVLPEPIDVTICGAGLGGSMIRLGWIGVGMVLELNAGGLRLITPPIMAVQIDRSLQLPDAA